MSLQDKLNQTEKEYNVGGKDNWFKFQEGNNKIRVLSEPVVIAEHFKQGICYGMTKGCKFHNEEDREPSVKWLTWIIDSKDNQIKLAKLPHKIFKAIVALETDKEYQFSSFPMPFDITVTAKNAGTKEVEYSVIPARANTPVESQFLEKLDKEKSPENIVIAMKKKQARKDGNTYLTDIEIKAKHELVDSQKVELDSEDINPDDIPF